MMSFFISADWSKRSDKRSVYIADLRNRRIRKEQPQGALWNIHTLLGRAKELSTDGHVLLGIDVVLGVPRDFWKLILSERRQNPPETFVEWLKSLDATERSFQTIDDPKEWRVDRPWFAVQKGPGGLKSFTKKLNSEMLRRIDSATGGKPLFAVSGIPGTVGSGTREVWKELIPHLLGEREFSIWPFEGDLDSLLKLGSPVVCETYPRLAYAAALANELPTKQEAISKTKIDHRASACNRLMHAEWVCAHRVDLGDLDSLRINDDDFDAHFTAAAVMRCVIEERPLCDAEWIESTAEGSMLLAGAVLPQRRPNRSTGSSDPSPPKLVGSLDLSKSDLMRPNAKREHHLRYPCPIPGCDKVFLGSRSGWDAHAASLRSHPTWRPEVTDPKNRRALFREGFSDWFR